MLRLEVFLSGHALRTFAGYFPTIMAMLPVKTQEFGLKKGTGLRKGAVEGVVVVSDGLDSLRVSNCEVSRRLWLPLW